MEECASVVAALKKSVRDVISKDHKKNGKKSMKRVKSVTVELSSKYLYPYDPAIRWTVKSKDSFDSLQVARLFVAFVKFPQHTCMRDGICRIGYIPVLCESLTLS